MVEGTALSPTGRGRGEGVTTYPYPDPPHPSAEALDLSPQGRGEPRSHPTKSNLTRDYYRVEDEEGRRYWVYREGLYQESEDGDPAWYLQGVFQ
ncbi:hypothetical protein A7A08_01495 [Methyloligella halotolerans]|uniref:Uncharacterized protein n=1 Tax=Methyloligella halotolerans TaxID=1177755 RepID=A0A1E2RZ03_9HYPH|nr:hypothetical protein A7A08_01495 [Methyloligella halotolerans]